MTWSDVSVEEFIELTELQQEELTPTERQLESIAIISGEDTDDLTEVELDELVKDYAWINTNPKSDAELPRFEKLSLGSVISLEKFVTEKAPLLNMDKVCALLYERGDFQTDVNFIRNQPVPEYYKATEGYLIYRKKLLENYDDLFLNDSEDEEEVDPEPQDQVQTRWAWMRLVYDLCDGDITKANAVLDLPHLMVLNWLTMIKDLKLNQPIRSVSDTV
jgi:hypothetical protein